MTKHLDMAHSKKLQDTIDIAKRLRSDRDKLLEDIEPYYQLETMEKTALQAFTHLSDKIDKCHRKLDVIHKVIGQYLMDEITGNEYLPDD